MNENTWSPEEVEQLKRWRGEGRPTAEIAEWLERTDTAVRLKLYSLGYSTRRRTPKGSVSSFAAPLASPPAPLPRSHLSPPTCDLPPALEQPPAPSPDQASALVRDSKNQAHLALDLKEARLARRKMEEQARQTVVIDRLVETFRERLSDFCPRFELVPPEPPDCAREEMHAAVLCVGDCHVGKVVSPAQTHSFGSYNPWQYCVRLAHLERRVSRLLVGGGLLPTDLLHIFFLGDVIEGVLDHGAEQESRLLLVDQCELATWTLHQFLLRLSRCVARIEIHAVAGNHGRLPNQRRVPTVNRYSNFDFFVYSSLALSLKAAGAKNINFNLNEAPRQLVCVRNWNFLVSHGDDLRGGGIPLRAIERRVANETHRQAANDRPYISYYVVGDKHAHSALPLGSGSFLTNGAFVGVDEYAMQFAPSPPSQLLFWVEESVGKTLQYDIRLDHATDTGELPYDLPPRLMNLVCGYGPHKRCA